MTSVEWNRSEVIAFLEDKIIDNLANKEELETYENYQMTGKLKNNYTYAKLIKEMNHIYNGGE